MMDLFGLFLSILSIVGGFLVSWKRVEGFYVWVVANVGWIIWCVIFHATGQMTMWFIYTVQSLLGVYKWHVSEETQSAHWNFIKVLFYKLTGKHKDRDCRMCHHHISYSHFPDCNINTTTLYDKGDVVAGICYKYKKIKGAKWNQDKKN